MSQPRCSSKMIDAPDVSKAAEVLYVAFVREKRYGPIDKLGLASSPDSLLVALYEVDRGVHAAIEGRLPRENLEALRKVMEAIASDARRPECLEEALRLAHELAVKALAKVGGEES